jgi:hypothetical protein
MSSGQDIAASMADYTRRGRGGTQTHQAEDTDDQHAAHITTSAPRDLSGNDARRDERMRNVASMLNADGTSPFGVVTADAAQIAAWQERKREKAELANFDAWVGKNFHKNDPMARKFLQETYPEYYEAREKLAVERAKFALRVFLLKLRGPKNQKDLILLWGLQTGRVRLDDGWDRIGYTFPKKDQAAAQLEQQNRFMKNLFGPYKYETGKSRKEYVESLKEHPELDPFRTGNEGLGGRQLDDGVFARGLSDNYSVSEFWGRK